MADRHPPLVPLLDAVNDLVAWLGATRISGVIIGGVAASLLGQPRFTRDVDVLVSVEPQSWSDFLSQGRSFGFSPRRADALGFAQAARVLLVRHEPSGVDVDIVFASLPFEDEALTRATVVEIQGVHVPLPMPEDLIIMKAVAGRPRDLGDIESLVHANPGLDLERVRRWVREFSGALGRPEIYKTLAALLPRPKRKTAKKKLKRKHARSKRAK